MGKGGRFLVGWYVTSLISENVKTQFVLLFANTNRIKNRSIFISAFFLQAVLRIGHWGGLHDHEAWFHHGILTYSLIHVFYYVLMQKKIICGCLLFVETL
jgi:hypothetical protein